MGSVVLIVRLCVWGGFLYLSCRAAFVTQSSADALFAATLGVLVLFDGFMIYRRIRLLQGQAQAHLVVLQRESRRLTLAQLQDAAERAWGVRPLASDEDDSRADAGGDPKPFGEKWALITGGEDESDWLINYRKELIFVRWQDGALFDERPPGMVDERQFAAIAEHRAAILISTVGAPETHDTDQVKSICRLLASLIDENTVAIGSERHNVFAVVDPTTIDRLRSENPESVFEQAAALVPVFGVEPDDPEMAEAVRKARDTLPEFRAAWQSRAGDEGFSVKCAITRGKITEHIWMRVTSMDDATLRGELGNTPFQLADLKEGDPVEIGPSDVQDWMIVNETKGELRGGYSVKYLAGKQRAAAKQ